MKWYYVEQGQQAGPVDDAQLDELLQTGRIQSDTLIWREGMANWAPYSEARGAARPGLRLATPVAAAGQTGEAPEAVCAECGQIFPIQNMIRYGQAHVCAACKPVFLQKLTEGARVNTGALNYAGFWIRFGAKIIDGLIIGVVFLAPLIFIEFKSTMEGDPEKYMGLRIFLQVGYYAAALLYSVFFIGKYGATPGKMVCKLQVVTAEGGKVSYGRATGRYFAEILSGIICNIGYIIAGFDEQKRALHDHICSTRVVFK